MNVVMVCSGGMSSAIVVKAILKEAEKQEFDLKMIAIGSGEVEEQLASEKYDLLLVAPQVKHQIDRLTKAAGEAGVPIEAVEPMGYTPLGAPKTILQIKKYKK